MAEQGRREVVGDPLALNPLAQAPNRDLAIMGVRNPGQTGGHALYDQTTQAMQAMQGFGDAIAGVMKKKEEENITEGKLQYMQGATEEQIAKTGNKYTMQGWQSLNAVDKANRWYANELVDIQNGGRTMDPTEYNKLMMQKRAAFMESLPSDPAIRKLYAAAFEDLGPRLTVQQTAAHNDYNTEQTDNNFKSLISSSSYTNADRPKIDGNSILALSPGVVRPTVKYTPEDLDILTRTMLGEASGEGPTGLSAVAHNIINRTIDGRWGKTISAVAKQPYQYSAWNNINEGGNNLVNADPNSAAYQKARQIAQDVLSGHVVDITNGATHYVAKGTKPNWYDNVAKESNGITQIGNHEYMGKARNLGVGTSEKTGVLQFTHPDQTDIDVDFASKLTNTGVQLGRNLTIDSGHRDAEYNAKVSGAKNSMHVKGQAVDISMKGMNDDERANLVRTLKNNGVRRFGTYSNHPDMLHVDMSEANGDNWYMYDKTNGKMAQAPTWFQNVATEPVVNGTNIAADATSDAQATADATGIPVGKDVSVAQTQTQDLIRGINMPNEKKAAFVADELITQFNSGNTQLWDNIGGTAFLRELGATPQQIRQVENAKQAWDKEQANKFSMERAEWESKLPIEVATGKKTLEEAKAEIQSKYDGKSIDDQAAEALVARVVAANVKEDKTYNMDPGLQRHLATVYSNIRTDPSTYNAEYGDAEVRRLAVIYGVPEQQLKQELAKVWSTEEQSKNALLAKAEQEANKAKTRQAKVDEVSAALAQGQGLDSVTGEIDGIPAKQWAINKRRTELMDIGSKTVQTLMSQGMPQADAIREAAATSEKVLWKELVQQGNVVDDTLAGSITAAVSGQFVDSAGKVNPSAREAFDTYMRLKDTDPTGAYASMYAKNEYSRNILMNAERFYDGSYDLDTALKKAHEFMANGITDPPDITKTDGFKAKLAVAVNDKWDTLMGTPGWFASSKISKEDEAFAKTNDAVQDQLNTAVTNRAWAYYAKEPQNDPEVILKKAAQDIMNNSSIVGGNILINREGKPTLKEQMGLQGYGNDVPSEAISAFVTEFGDRQIQLKKTTGTDKTGWAKEWAARKSGGWFDPSGGPIWQSEKNAEFYATWDQDAGYVSIQLWKDSTRKNTLDPSEAATINPSLKEIGEWYRKQQKERDSSGFQQFYKDMWGTVMGDPNVVHDSNDNPNK